MNYIKSISLSIFTLLFIISCNQFGDDFKLPGENPKDIIYFELDNDYLAPESKEFIETNFSSNNVNTSYVLIGKKTYGFEADLDNQMSLSFDEDGNYKLDRDHPFLKDNYKKGKFNNSDSDKREDKDKEEDKGEDKDREDKDEEEEVQARPDRGLLPPVGLLQAGGTAAQQLRHRRRGRGQPVQVARSSPRGHVGPLRRRAV